MASVLSSLRPGTEVANILEQKWAPGFGFVANEEAVIVNTFDDGQVEGKFGNTLNLSKIDTKTARAIGTTDQVDAGALTFETDTEANVTVSARDIYAAVAIGENTKARMLREAAFETGLKRQLMAALMVDLDSTAAALVPNLSTSVIGGAGVDLSKSLLLQGLEKLAQNAKENFRLGVDPAFLTIYPLQIGDLFSIVEITSADMRGDGANPNVTAQVWKAYNLQIRETGNISVSGGVAHNFLRIKPSHVVAYNVRPKPMEPQMNGLSTLLIAFASYGVGEFFDEWAVDINTKTT